MDTSYHYLVSCGVHVGHSLRNSHKLCGWMVLAQRHKVLLIDLSKFLYMFSKGLLLLQHAVRFLHPIWFITLDPMKASVLSLASKLCGEYHVSTHWIGGLLTNFMEVSQTSWWRYNYLSPLVHSAKQLLRQQLYEDWMLTRFTWPRVIFLCGVRHSYRVAKEALCARIACIGIADTATNAHTLSLAVPGNDESLEALYFYNCLVAQTILLKKFVHVFGWGANVRKTSRLGHFAQWFAFRNSWRLKKFSRSLPSKAPRFPSSSSGLLHFWGSSHSSFFTTASLMHHLLQYRLGVPKMVHKGSEFLYLEGDLSKQSSSYLTPTQVRAFFLEQNLRFNTMFSLHLLSLRFFGENKEFLSRWTGRYYYFFGQRRRLHFNPKKYTLAFGHPYLDLLAPSGFPGERTLEKDYVYRRAAEFVDEGLERSRHNRYAEELFFRLLSTLFLLYSYFQGVPLQTPSAALQPKNYEEGSILRRLKREQPQADELFKDIILGFMVRTLHLTHTVSRSYSLPFLPLKRLPKIAPLPGNRKYRSLSWKALRYFRLRFKSFKKTGLPRSLWFRMLLDKVSGSSSKISIYDIAHMDKTLGFMLPKAEASEVKFPKKSKVYSKSFSFFAINKWHFYRGALPKLYWQFQLLYYPTERNNLPISLENKQRERNWVQGRLKSYSLLHRSLFWRRKHRSLVQ